MKLTAPQGGARALFYFFSRKPLFLQQSFDEAVEQRFRLFQPRIEFRMVLRAYEELVAFQFPDFANFPFRVAARENPSYLFQVGNEFGVDFVAVAGALVDFLALAAFARQRVFL